MPFVEEIKGTNHQNITFLKGARFFFGPSVSTALYQEHINWLNYDFFSTINGLANVNIYIRGSASDQQIINQRIAEIVETIRLFRRFSGNIQTYPSVDRNFANEKIEIVAIIVREPNEKHPAEVEIPFPTALKSLISGIWIGALAKAGGFLGPIGGESSIGGIIKLESAFTGNWCHASLCGATNWKIGLGLGGSAGLGILIVFNAKSYQELKGLDVGGLNVNVAFTSKLPQLAKCIPSIEEYKALDKFAQLPKTIEAKNKGSAITNFFNNVLTAFSEDAKCGRPTAFSFDVSGAGIELSCGYTLGKSVLEIY